MGGKCMNIKDWKEFSDLVDEKNKEAWKKADKLNKEWRLKEKNRIEKERFDNKIKRANYRQELLIWQLEEPKQYRGLFFTNPDWEVWFFKKPREPFVYDFNPIIFNTAYPSLLDKTLENYYEWKVGKLKL